VKFNLPINEESESIFSKIPLAQFQVLRMESNRLASDYLYSLEDNPLLRINSSSGEIYMRTDYSAPNSSVKYVVTAFPRDQPDHELLPVSHLTLEVTPQSLEDYCSELEHICFWRSAEYSIAESQGQYRRRDSFEPVLIGSLNSRAAKYLCHVSLDYSLNAGSSHFVLKQNRLYTRQPLDHDELNGLNAKAGQLQARITCTIKLSTRDQRKFSRSFDIKLLDRNDNGPKLQESDSRFEFYLEQPYFQAVSSGIPGVGGLTKERISGVEASQPDPAQTIRLPAVWPLTGCGLIEFTHDERPLNTQPSQLHLKKQN